mmetsp:Transcript_20863/g.33759  ORF Transcript_20863/g.33759 Transcript_20863/m.33759 type:complete len:87 (+) Transcript_20863:32-292(+)
MLEVESEERGCDSIPPSSSNNRLSACSDIGASFNTGGIKIIVLTFYGKPVLPPPFPLWQYTVHFIMLVHSDNIFALFNLIFFLLCL